MGIFPIVRRLNRKHGELLASTARQWSMSASGEWLLAWTVLNTLERAGSLSSLLVTEIVDPYDVRMGGVIDAFASPSPHQALSDAERLHTGLRWTLASSIRRTLQITFHNRPQQNFKASSRPALDCLSPTPGGVRIPRSIWSLVLHRGEQLLLSNRLKLVS